MEQQPIKQKRVMTDEQREQMKERMAKLREIKSQRKLDPEYVKPEKKSKSVADEDYVTLQLSKKLLSDLKKQEKAKRISKKSIKQVVTEESAQDTQ